MRGQTLDFDRFLSEKRQEYVTVNVFGESYRVKREIPALLPLMLARAGEEDARPVLGRTLLQAGEILFGAETLRGFALRGMSAGEMAELVERTLALICGVEEEGMTLEDDGAAESRGDDAVKK